MYYVHKEGNTEAEKNRHHLNVKAGVITTEPHHPLQNIMLGQEPTGSNQLLLQHAVLQLQGQPGVGWEDAALSTLQVLHLDLG